MDYLTHLLNENAGALLLLGITGAIASWGSLKRSVGKIDTGVQLLSQRLDQNDAIRNDVKLGPVTRAEHDAHVEALDSRVKRLEESRPRRVS